MSKVCQVTGLKPAVGNNRSHARNATKRRFLPNIRTKRFWSSVRGSFVKLKVSSKGIRMIDKLGLDKVLELKGI